MKMNYKILSVATIIASSLLIVGCSAKSDSNSSKPNPPVPTALENPIYIVPAGTIPSFSGSPTTVDIIVGNRSDKPVVGINYSFLNKSTEVSEPSVASCSMIPAHGECRIPIAFTNDSTAQVVHAEYKNSSGHDKQVSMQYNRTFIHDSEHGTGLYHGTQTPVMVDVGGGMLEGVFYVVAKNMDGKVFNYKEINFSNTSWKLNSVNFTANTQLNDKTLIQIVYSAPKISNQVTSVNNSAGYSLLTMTDSNNNTLKYGLTATTLQGSFLVASTLNPIDSSQTSPTETLTITNIGLTAASSGATLAIAPANGFATNYVTASPTTFPSIGVSSSVTSTIGVNASLVYGSSVITLTNTATGQTVPMPVSVVNGGQAPIVGMDVMSYSVPSSSGPNSGSTSESANLTVYNQGTLAVTGVSITLPVHPTSDPTTTISIPNNGGSNTYTKCGTIPANGTCVIPNVTLQSSSNSTISQGYFQYTINYQYGSQPTNGVSKGLIGYTVIVQNTISITESSPTISVIGNLESVNNTGIVIVTNSGTSNNIKIESFSMTNNNSPASWNTQGNPWFYLSGPIGSTPACAVGTQVAPGQSCYMGLTLGPIDIADIGGQNANPNPNSPYNNNESVTVGYVTLPLADVWQIANSAPIPFTVLPDNTLITISGVSAYIASGSGTSSQPYQFSGADSGNMQTISVTYQNSGSNVITINKIQQMVDPLYWTINDGCTGKQLNINSTCTITYNYNFLNYITKTIQSGSIIPVNIVLPTFVFSESVTNTNFYATPTYNNANTVFANENVLFISHTPQVVVSSSTANMVSSYTTSGGFSAAQYNFSEVTTFANNGFFANGSVPTPTAGCSSVWSAESMTQTCSGVTGLPASNYGVSYPMTTASYGGVFTINFAISATAGQSIAQNMYSMVESF